jgi:hypothetical protein
MDPEIVEQIFDELFPTFQSLETQSAAIMQFLKDKGIASEDQLAPYLEQAANASSVRWRVARLRMARLLAAADKSEKVAKEPVASATVQAEKTAEKNEDKRSTAEDKAEKNKDATKKGQQGSEKEQGSEKGQVRAKNNAPTDSKPTSRDEEPKREPTNENLDSKNSRPVQAGAKPSESTKSTGEDAEGESKASDFDEPARKRA